MKLFRELWRHTKEMKHYIIASVLVFAGGIFLGLNSHHFASYLDGQMQDVGKIADLISKMHYAQFWFFVFIFLNNAVKAIVIIYLGVIFGIIPLYFLLVNGMVLGHLLSKALEAHHNIFQLIVQGILPHGIIEIPAVIIACAYGIKFGALILKGLFSVVNPAARTASGKEISHFIRLTLPLMMALVILLFVSAIIESTITYWLVRL